jgi:hypothetical protein
VNKSDDMSNELRTPQAMVVWASAPLWPMLSLVSHWHRPEGLRQVHILHAVQPAESILSALRLRHLLNALYPEIQVTLPERAGSASPQAVTAQIESWLSQQPDIDWLLLGCGTTPAWNMGLTAFAGRPRVQIISQESPGTWNEWQRPSSQNGVVLAELEGFAPARPDALSIELLLKSQFMTSEKSPLYVGESGRSLPLRRLTEFGAANGWDWPAAFKDSGLEATGNPAALFARYLAAGLGELGVGNLVQNLKITPQPEGRGKEIITLDLAANTGEQLLIHPDANATACRMATPIEHFVVTLDDGSALSVIIRR